MAGVATATGITAATAATVAVVAGVVIVALLIAAMAAWKLWDQAQVGERLTRAMNDAAAATDPFGLEQLRTQNAGKPLRDGMTRDNLPGYRNPDSRARLWQQVTLWTTVTPDGLVRADPDDLRGDSLWDYERSDRITVSGFRDLTCCRTAFRCRQATGGKNSDSMTAG